MEMQRPNGVTSILAQVPKKGFNGCLKLAHIWQHLIHAQDPRILISRIIIS